MFADETEAASAIASAKQEIVVCFEAARGAEGLGADISVLTAILNDAIVLLSNAELAYSQGDFNASRDLAVQSRQDLANFVPFANALAVSGAEAGFRDFLINVVGSIVSAVAVIVAGFVIWVYLKRRYEVAEGQAVAATRV